MLNDFLRKGYIVSGIIRMQFWFCLYVILLVSNILLDEYDYLYFFYR